MAQRVGHRPCTHRTVYRLTCEEYDRLVVRAEGRCDRCGKQTPRHVIDHDHAIGPHAVRGLLDQRCNIIVSTVEQFVAPAGPDPLTVAYLRRPFHAELPEAVMAARATRLTAVTMPAPLRDRWQVCWGTSPLVDVAEAAVLLDLAAVEVVALAERGRLPYWRREPWAFRRRAVLEARMLYAPQINQDSKES